VTIEGARRILSASGKNLLEDFSIIDSGTDALGHAEQSLASLALSFASSAAVSSSTTTSLIAAERDGGALTALTFVVFAYPQTAVRLCTLEPFISSGGGDSAASKKKKKRKGKSKRAVAACGFSEAELATIRIASDVQEFVPTEVRLSREAIVLPTDYIDYFDIVFHVSCQKNQK
jgi:hypothetical protein